MTIFYKLTHSIFKFLFRLFYKNEIFGIEIIPPGAAILVANHLSFLDPPLIGCSCPDELNYFARSSLFENPLFGYGISKLGAYPLQGDTHDLSSFKIILQHLKQRKKVVIFPEGARSEDGKFSKLRPGFARLALRAGCPIIPVYIHGTYEIWPSKQKLPKMFGKTVCIFGSPIKVSVLDKLSKKAAQEDIVASTLRAWENLKRWYENGAIGTPP